MTIETGLLSTGSAGLDAFSRFVLGYVYVCDFVFCYVNCLTNTLGFFCTWDVGVVKTAGLESCLRGYRSVFF